MATRFQNDSFGTDTEISCRQQATRPARREHPRRRWVRLLVLATAVSAVVAPSSGCTMARGLGRMMSRHDALDEFMVDYRNRAWSARAWLCRKDRFRHHEALSDFEAGFRQGYEDVAAGGSGCVPAVCPKAYWGWQYQSASGQGRMNAWFEGYPLGVQAAEEDGIGHWGHVATSFAAPPPCQNCPTGAVMAVPAVPEGEPILGSGQVETIAPPPLSDPDPLPAPAFDPINAPELPSGPQLIEN